MDRLVTHDFLAGGGEMGALMRAHDWAATPIGTPDIWPQSLRAAVRILLNTGHPMFIWWGPELIQFYNDAYRQTMGPERHPSALGQRGRECWDEIWPIIGPQIEYVMSGQGSTWDVEKLVPVTRHGKREDVWWTYSYGPIDLEGGVGGVLVVCTDVTEQRRAREALSNQTRRLETLFEQAPGFMAVLRGPEHTFELTNNAYRKLIGGRDVVGKPIEEALPEIAGQGFVDLLSTVYRTGEPHIGRRAPVMLHNEPGAPMAQVFLDFIYQPIVGPDGKISGVFVEGVDVTDHVRTEEHLRLVNDELKHRVKNTLAVVSAIASQTMRSGVEADEALAAFHARLGAFGRAHDILTANAGSRAPIDSVIATALEVHAGNNGRIVAGGPPVVLGSRQALSLALAVHELATNAGKYGALSNDTGRVSIDWREVDRGGVPVFVFTWRESGGPPVIAPSRKGFGSTLIERVLTADFDAEVDVRYEPEGLVAALTAPSENLVRSTPSAGG
jgi:two-component sensor histidine kinase